MILKEHVEHLGRRGEIVKVADGYARNYLFPRKLALAVTDENKRQIERERAKAEARDAEELQDGAGARGAARGASRSADRPPRRRARHALRVGHRRRTSPRRSPRASSTVDRRKIQLADPLKTLGEHDGAPSSCTAT